MQEVDKSEIDDDWFDGRYFRALEAANRKLAQGLISRNEVQAIKKESPALYNYNYLFIDEAQDWHDSEREFICHLYDRRNLVLGVGDRQLVRSDKPCDWHPGEDIEAVNTRLTKCLRLTPNVAHFVNCIARHMGDSDFRVVADDEMRGGSVHIVLGTLANSLELVEQLVKSADELGNANVDHLFCVPPETIEKREEKRYSRLGNCLRARGYAVYDAVDREVRMGTPESSADLRIVQYDSCRGLEGWAVFLETLDTFYDRKHAQASSDFAQKDMLAFLKENLASARALDWTLIPLTRAIDTLVISIASATSALGSVILKVAAENPDFAEVHAGRSSIATAHYAR